MAAVLKLFDLVPGWVYALVVLALLVLLGISRIAQADAESGEAKAIATLERERTAHATALAKQTALVLQATNQLTAARAAQERRDGDAQATIAQLGEDLRRRSRAAGGAGLRDPFAAAGSCQPTGGPGAAAAAGGEDPAEAGRVLSPQLEGLLLERFAEADAINIAYDSCRTDALILRATIRQLQPAPVTP